ncbi:PTS system mannose/fructose/sorbose family transporter subunit IID [Lactobacillus gigeriorum]|uniref:PTS system, mannose-specific IID component n=1 Tax=Lactobacillus gigeriorum DSM 23908 = CRBIP 24.85 TaxID=1423751 RepID=I7K0U7_9LACO|nr:PTS system mannose/fructose/sorbose family transporter subunit IID [Lactobacillus gigeriorum]KRN09300.1 hypothetical protein FC38_GL001443 [Lactobacillus gigeriorum DSM 23908 = CRBIP 24.85]CCI87075.1 PTS system, mannose-specific IID component [Lactobacillus gigeriorum DSM 23908 = CRBIP 24.85]
MADKEVKLTKRDRFSVMWHSQFLQGSWNYERMQNGGYVYSLIPALRKLYPNKEDMAAALQRHLVFFNTHPYIAAPVLGVTLALEEDKANGVNVQDEAIQGVKVGMMGPLAGVGDPVFWFTVRPIVGALGASMAIQGNILGPILFFVIWNLIRLGFLWYTQEFGYKAGSAITNDMSGGMLKKVTRGASMMGMFVLGSLIERWVSIKFTPIVSQTPIQKGGYIEWDKLASGGKGIQEALLQWNMGNGKALTNVKTTTLQNNLDQLIPGLAGLLLTFLCMWLLKKKVSPIWIIIGIFVVGVLFHVWGIL